MSQKCVEIFLESKFFIVLILRKKVKQLQICSSCNYMSLEKRLIILRNFKQFLFEVLENKRHKFSFTNHSFQKRFVFVYFKNRRYENERISFLFKKRF